MTTAIRAPRHRLTIVAGLCAVTFLTNLFIGSLRAEDVPHEMRETTVLFYKDGGLFRVTPASASQKQDGWEPPELHLRLDSADMQRLLQYTMTDNLPWEFRGFTS